MKAHDHSDGAVELARDAGPGDGERLVAAIQELSHLHDLEGVMAVVRRTARELTGADGVTFILREGDRVFYADESAITPLWKGRRFPIEHCISGWAMVNRREAVIEDIYADGRIPFDAYRSTFVKSLAVVPVRIADPVGAIGAYWASPHRATAREMRILSTLAGSTAIALTNAELYRQASEARAAAEAASRAKDEFLAVLSHELRTPLTTILAWSTLLRTKRLDAPALARAHELIDRNARAQAALMDNLLDISLVIADRLVLAPTRLDLRDVVRAAVDTAASAAAAKGVALELELASEPLPVDGDPARLRQAAEALLGNGVKFTPAGGRVHVLCRRAGERVELAVTDTGQGITAEFLPRLFERFRQEDGGHRRSHSGLGLGLALARHVVELHGGTIHAESEGRERGARFVITLAPATG